MDIILYRIYPCYFQDSFRIYHQKTNPTRKKINKKSHKKKNKLIHIFKMMKKNIQNEDDDLEEDEKIKVVDNFKKKEKEK